MNILFYHQGYISCINYPSNKLCFIRRVLNKPRRKIHWVNVRLLFRALFFELFTHCSVLCVWCMKYSLNMLYTKITSAITINNWGPQYREKSNHLNLRQISRSWQHGIKKADNAGQFIKMIFILFILHTKNKCWFLRFKWYKKNYWIEDHISIVFRFRFPD